MTILEKNQRLIEVNLLVKFNILVYEHCFSYYLSRIKDTNAKLYVTRFTRHYSGRYFQFLHFNARERHANKLIKGTRINIVYARIAFLFITDSSVTLESNKLNSQLHDVLKSVEDTQLQKLKASKVNTGCSS